MTTRSHGRRIAEAVPGGRRPGPLLAVGLSAVLVSALALAAQAPAAEQAERTPTPPRTEPLEALTLVCPGSGEAEAGPVALVSTQPKQGTGEVTERSPGDDGPAPVRLPSRGARTVSEEAPLVVAGSGGRAPGLLGARLGGLGRTAAGECVTPEAERWFAGVGSGGGHVSRLLLVNPDAGPAVADVTLWSTEGVLEQVESRGLTVAGGGSTVIDLEDVAPHRNELVMRVAVVRGRLGAVVEDDYAIGLAPRTYEWVPSSAAPATSLLVPGLPRDADDHTLTIVNPGESAGRVSVQVVGQDSTFTPAGLDDIEVPAGRTVVTDVTEPLLGQLRGEDVALLLTGTVPVTAGLRSMVDGDLAHLAAVARVEAETSAAMVPRSGTSVLVLAGAETAGRVDVRFPGSEQERRVRLRPDISVAVPVPAGADAVVVEGRTPVAGAVRTVGSSGAVVLPLRPLPLEEDIPSVRPAWP